MIKFYGLPVGACIAHPQICNLMFFNGRPMVATTTFAINFVTQITAYLKASNNSATAFGTYLSTDLLLLYNSITTLEDKYPKSPALK